MRRLRRVALLLVTALVGIIGALPTVATAAGPAATPPSQCPSNGVAASVSAPQLLDASYFQDNFLLGPKFLPKTGEVAQLLDHYQRFHAMGPNQFLACYSRPGQWLYPPDHGFAPGTKERAKVRVGEILQRFGSPSGQQLAPCGTLYGQVAIPPSNLDTFNDTSAPFNYYRFKVTKTFEIDQGKAAPWFQQPGGGIQDYTANAIDANGPVPTTNPDGVTNNDLVANGDLQRVPTDQANAPCPS